MPELTKRGRRSTRQVSRSHRFSSKILPPYLRKTKAIEELIPWLYLKGVSTGDFAEALQALVGPQAAGLSATTITRLVTAWQDEHKSWSHRTLEGKQYVYLWADGIHFNVRLEEDRQCILVLMGATAEGKKELIAVADGHRESEQSWYTLLLDCKQRGLTLDPKVATADGALGFWKALPQVWPTTRAQRCWVHKTANVLDKMAKKVQSGAKEKLHQIWMASTRADAEQAFDHFCCSLQREVPRRGRVAYRRTGSSVLTFYDFPAEHWLHLRTTNPIESTFATVRLRHRRTKGNGSRVACLAMVFKLCESAARRWRLLNGAKLLPEVIAGAKVHRRRKTREGRRLKAGPSTIFDNTSWPGHWFRTRWNGVCGAYCDHHSLQLGGRESWRVVLIYTYDADLATWHVGSGAYIVDTRLEYRPCAGNALLGLRSRQDGLVR